MLSTEVELGRREEKTFARDWGAIKYTQQASADSKGEATETRQCRGKDRAERIGREHTLLDGW